jgi:hypothetical protein
LDDTRLTKEVYEGGLDGNADKGTRTLLHQIKQVLEKGQVIIIISLSMLPLLEHRPSGLVGDSEFRLMKFLISQCFAIRLEI